MTRYVTIRMTREQAQAASNACDLIADSLRADGPGQGREASLYERASATLNQIPELANTPRTTPRRSRR